MCHIWPVAFYYSGGEREREAGERMTRVGRRLLLVLAGGFRV